MTASVPKNSRISTDMIAATIFRLDFLNIAAPQFIPNPAHRLDLRLCPHKIQLFACERHIYFYIVILSFIFIPPYFQGKLLTGKDLSLVGDQIFEDAVFLFAQTDTLPIRRTDQG